MPEDLLYRAQWHACQSVSQEFSGTLAILFPGVQWHACQSVSLEFSGTLANILTGVEWHACLSAC